jgi:hypothetical protein
MLSREDVEVYLHALQTITEQFSCVNGDIVILEDCIIVRKNNIRIMECTRLPNHST